VCRLTCDGSVMVSESTRRSLPTTTVSPVSSSNSRSRPLAFETGHRRLAVVEPAAGQEPPPGDGEGQGGPSEEHAATGVDADPVGRNALAPFGSFWHHWLTGGWSRAGAMA